MEQIDEIPGFPGYGITPSGKVYSKKKIAWQWQPLTARIIDDTHKQLYVTLAVTTGQYKRFRVDYLHHLTYG